MYIVENNRPDTDSEVRIAKDPQRVGFSLFSVKQQALLYCNFMRSGPSKVKLWPSPDSRVSQ